MYAAYAAGEKQHLLAQKRNQKKNVLTSQAELGETVAVRFRAIRVIIW